MFSRHYRIDDLFPHFFIDGYILLSRCQVLIENTSVIMKTHISKIGNLKIDVQKHRNFLHNKYYTERKLLVNIKIKIIVNLYKLVWFLNEYHAVNDLTVRTYEFYFYRW